MVAQLPPDSRFPEYGAQVGSWIVQERIGSGSHGVVFRVVHADRPEGSSYALKLAQEPDDARMEREIRLLSRIRHASVPRLEDSGVWTSPRGDRYPYLVMEWVEGVSLYAWAQEHGLTLFQAVSQLAQLARALEAIHRHGVHRDVKGGNVRVSEEGHAVLLDFGSCWYPGARPLTEGTLPPGTHAYRSPQMIFFGFALRRGATGYYYEAEPADDVYSLGVTAYRLLDGSYPPIDTDANGGLNKAVRLVPPRGLEEACPELSALILRMLSEDPEARGSARQVAEELERLLRRAHPALKRIWREGTASSLPPTEKTRRLEPGRDGLTQLAPCLAPAGIVFALALLFGPLTHDMEADSTKQKAEKPDGGTALGEEAVVSVAPAGTPPVSPGKIAREMPDEPLPGQKRPPCNSRGAMEINGGCWLTIMGAEKAPCDPRDYEYEGRCYFPLLTKAERVPTSEEPQ